LVELLLEYRADPAAHDSDDHSPGDLARSRGHVALADLLDEARKRPPDILARDSEGRFPLHLAILDRLPQVVPGLVAQGADVNARDKHGCTPLHLAVQAELPEAADALIQAGADRNSPDLMGRSPLHWAAALGSPQVAEVLVSRGAHVDARDQRGLAPLHVAAMEGREDVARGLLDGGADVNIRDLQGNTPLLLAAAGGQMGIARLLLARGAWVNDADQSGSAPFQAAIAGRQWSVARLLAEHGARVAGTYIVPAENVQRLLDVAHAVSHELEREEESRAFVTLRGPISRAMRPTDRQAPKERPGGANAWTCNRCGHTMERSHWLERRAGREGGLFVWCRCPFCGETVDLAAPEEWACSACGHRMEKGQWLQHKSRGEPSWFGENVWYCCPLCQREVEMWPL
jgi:ankyrin repeat protein